jgi:5-methylcytosine-specific restriction endonuclease McrA
MGKKKKVKIDSVWGIPYEKGSLMDLLNRIEQPKKVEGKPRKGLPRGLLMRLMVRSEGKCENCNRSLRDVKIHIHHKNYDPADNRESNLMVLCKDCHVKLTGPPPKRGKSVKNEPQVSKGKIKSVGDYILGR